MAPWKMGKGNEKLNKLSVFWLQKISGKLLEHRCKSRKVLTSYSFLLKFMH